jgi:hypothetical protein
MKMSRLRRCSIIFCDSLKCLNPVNDIPEVNLAYRSSESSVISQTDLDVLKDGKYERFEFTASSLCSYDLSFLTGVSKELLIYAYPKADFDFSVFSHVEQLSISGCDLEPVLPMKKFEGKILSIESYDLFLFSPNEFEAPNLNKLLLKECDNVPLQVFTKSPITTLSLDNCIYDNLLISRFKVLTKLVIVNGIDSPFDWGSVTHLWYFRNIHHVELHIEDGYSHNLTSLSGLCNGNHSIILDGLKEISNFSFLNRLDKVEIRNCDGLINGKGLERVRHLTIADCKNFSDCSSLLDTDISLVHLLKLENLSKLQTLKGQVSKTLCFIKVINCPLLEAYPN